jgi:hypothetical protein
MGRCGSSLLPTLIASYRRTGIEKSKPLFPNKVAISCGCRDESENKFGRNSDDAKIMSEEET